MRGSSWRGTATLKCRGPGPAIYDHARTALKDRLTGITGGYYVIYVEYRGAKTITIHDVSSSHLWPPPAVLARPPPLRGPTANWNLTLKRLQVIHSLRRLGAPIYDFDPETYHATKKSQEGLIDRSWPTAFFSTPK
ncbi:hypothetical protein CCHR01_13817 [Colletotrichum chrysophilum]|uniref:Uncharacterized protein n=1 Tax=Colletotrichum chrysophilum TaxID=1836956 RepID=A0AAD9EA54_9PEZI|nr:hypothetical protein CCHR01_13817 [Colletotrichum chrysophilum]